VDILRETPRAVGRGATWCPPRMLCRRRGCRLPVTNRSIASAAFSGLRAQSGAREPVGGGTTLASPVRWPCLGGRVTRSKLLPLACAVLGAALLLPTDAHAQRRPVVRSGGARSVVVVGAHFHRPWFYDPWYGWGHPYGWYPPYVFAGRYEDSAAVRLDVDPKEAEVFIDGYYAGTVDDFDGVFQRLRIEPGEHDIELYLAGHRSFRQKIYLQPTGTFRVRHTMEQLPAGAPPDPRPVAPASPPPRRGGGYDASGRPERPERAGRPERSDPSSAYGTLAIRVQPEAADVLIDGESWDGPAGAERLVIQLPEGEHQVEVHLEGYASYTSRVQVRRGETTPLNVSLAKE
jgi:hypothetical protein